ncbi:MAG: TVP38/TMEM64 family protein [Verrucomicrobiales bacterium]|jgi:uncharacterized membrane protein YdjX (TVP38/TMEM64 family)|nr:TVP38/TMEM64 family protein [Verrucomicrobiales bacterium]MBP9224185.1 TVP38/TMEM64 family protein [Verrucomicrobiales bacterium]
MKRLLLLFLLLALLVIAPFLLWGEAIEKSMSFDETVAAMRATGAWAWLVGIGLLVIDLFLPILGTIVMSALGLIYGWFLGGFFSALGSITSGVLAYALSRRLGRKAALWMTGAEGLEEGERIFGGELGGWIVALSRWMPVLPEVIAVMAGMSRMPFRRFFLALCAGSLPMSFVFAWIGDTGVDRPGLAIGLSAGLPVLMWLIFRIFYRRSR